MRSHILCLAIGLAAGLTSATVHAQKAAMAKHASGTFDVKVTPQKDDGIGDPTIGRMSIDKVYHGDLEGTGLGQMLTGMSAEVKDSGTYVAIERVHGTLQGRKGGFAVSHIGTMTRGKQSLKIAVIPDSGTGELTGIPGTLPLDRRDGQHFLGVALPDDVLIELLEDAPRCDMQKAIDLTLFLHQAPHSSIAEGSEIKDQ